MNIIILNTNSFGGNYEYSRCLAQAYAAHADVTQCVVLIPASAAQKEDHVFKKILLADVIQTKNKIIRKIYFLYRSLINPFRVRTFLKKQPASLVIFNDYEQITSFVWVPFFRSLKKKHTFAVILHDPDRDRYLPVKALSVQTMKSVMSIMDLALYHELLPDKAYYKKELPKINVPHGIYNFPAFNTDFFEFIKQQKGSDILLGMLGNIRDEKNYTLIIESLPRLTGIKLLIAGDASSSNVPVEEYKARIDQLQLQDRVICVQKRLSDEELQAAIRICDGILLYYKKSFASQSGILNLIAPHRRPLVVSDTASALTETVRKYGIGYVVPLGSTEFVSAIQEIFQPNMRNLDQQWDTYLGHASWKNHVQIVMEHLKMNTPDQ